jgi:NAD(P)-dependent dehydrogenase (short-subunit alcohol dehydrogenase family)
MRRFEGKRVLVLGGGADGPASEDSDLPMGNGRAIAMRLADEGASVAVTDVHHDRAQATVNVLATPGVAIRADLADPVECRQSIEIAEREIGPLDVIVANAAITDLRPLRAFDEATWARTFDVNLTGQAITAHAALSRMLSRGSGIFVFVSSAAGIMSSGASIAYETSKAAQLALMRHIAVRYASRGIRSNALVLGIIDSTMVRRLFGSSPAAVTARNRLGPMQRQGLPSEVGAAAAFLASSDSSFVNGHSLVIDGGISVQWPSPELDALANRGAV